MSIPVVPGAGRPVGSPQRSLGGNINSLAGMAGISPSSHRVVSQPQEQKIVQDILDCINDLKTEFEETRIPINDDNQQLHRFCAKLEYLLQCNMKEKKNLLGRKKDYWDYFCDCLGSTKGISDGIRFVKSLGEYKSSIGKGRAFLRFCLMHNRMADSIQACIVNGKTTSDWYFPQSLWLQHERNSILINALYDLSELQFDLAPRGYDLDNAWPSFAKKNLGSVHNWNLSTRSRTSSISSLISIPGQEASPQKNFGLSTTPSDIGDVDHLNQELSVSESIRSDLTDKIEALQQQKSVFQQSVAHTQGELDVLNQQLNDFKSQNQQLTKEYQDLKQRYDRLMLEQESKQKDWEVKENEHTQKKEEIEKLFDQVMTQDDKIQSQGETINELEKSKNELQFEVKSLNQNMETNKSILSKRDEEITSLEDKLRKQEEKNEELLIKVENLLLDKNNEASTQLDSVGKLQETLVAMKELESQNLRLDSQKEELTRKCDSLQSDLESKCSILSETENEKQKYLIEKQNLQQEIEQLNNKNSESLNKINGLETELCSLSTKCKNDSSSHDEKIANFTEEISELKSGKSDLEVCLKQKASELEILQKEWENLKSEKDSVEQKFCKLNEDMNTLKVQSEKSQELSAENENKLKTSLEEKEEIIKSLQAKVDESENCRLTIENSLKERNDHIENLNTNLRELETMNQGLESKCLSLEKDLSSLKECQEIEKGSSEEIKEKLEEKMEVVKTLELQLDEVKVLMELLISGDKLSESTEIPTVLQKSELGCVFSSLMKHRIDDMKTKEELKSHNKTLAAESDLVRQKSEEKGRQLQDLQCSFDALQQNKIEIELKFADIEKTLNLSVKELKEDNSEKDSQIQELSNVKEKLENKNCDLEKQISDRGEALKVSAENILSLEKTVESLKERYSVLKENEGKLQGEIKNLQESVVTKETEIAEFREKSMRTEDILRQNSEKMESESNLANQLLADLKDKDQSIQQLQQKVSELNSTVESCHEMEKGIKKETKVLEEKNENLTSELSALQQKFNAKSEEFKTESEKLNTALTEKATLEQKLKESKEKQFDLEQKLTSTKKEFEDSQKDNQKVLNKLEVERHNMTKHLEDAIKDIESIKQQLTVTSSELSLAYSEKERLESELNDLGVKRDELLTEVDRTSKENRSLTIDVENIQEKVTDFSNKCIDLEEKLKNSNTENENLRRELVDLKNENEKLTSVKDDLEDKSGNIEDEMRKLNEKLEEIQLEKETVMEEKISLDSKVVDLQAEITVKNSQFQEEQLAKEQVDKELRQFKLSAEENKLLAESDLEKLNLEHDQEMEMLKQEVTSLQFQLSSEQIKYEQTVQNYSEHDSSITDMKDKLIEQEQLIEQLESEMSEIRSCRSMEQNKQLQELEELRKYIASLDEDKKDLYTKYQQISKELESEKLTVVSLQTKLKEEEEDKDGVCKEKEQEIDELKSDTKQLKKKLIKLIKEKDSLWQKTDQLSYQQKMQAKDKWIDEKNITQCMGCKTDFSFTLRKHHCRICGRVFCYQCSDNWIQTTHSSKKSRACNSCYRRYKEAEEEGTLNSNNTDDDLEDTVEIPKLHKSRGVMNESVSSTMSASSTQDNISQASSDDMVAKETSPVTIPGQVATAITVSMVDGNIPDEIKEKQKNQKDDNFQVISEDEISKSRTESEIQFHTSDPNMTSSITISTDDLEKGQVNSQSETWIKPGKTFAVPVLVDRFNTTLCWEFNSSPKDIIFAVHYQTMTGSNSEVLIPPCKVDAHKQVVKGELTAKQLGIYSLMFDNTHSRLTSKKVTYKLWSKKAE